MMELAGAIVFLPREGNGRSLMLEDLLFDPAALWLAEALRRAGVERFLVVCHRDDQEEASACFPEGTEFITTGTDDANQRLGAFLHGREGRVAVVTGVPRLSGAVVRCTDLRGGAALLVAGLAAEGETEIEEIHHICRGYEDPVRDLSILGGDVRWEER